MKVIKIDVVKKELYYVHINKKKDGKENRNGSHLDDIYKHLECHCIDIVSITPILDLCIDDEGLLVDPPIGAFRVNGSDYVFSGHGLFIGNYGDGSSCEPPITLENAQKAIIFCDISDLPEPFMQVITE